MSITLEKYQLIDIIKGASEMGAKAAMIEAGLLNPYLTQTFAYKKYGRRAVDQWIREGKITAHKSGDKNSKVLIDRLEIQVLFKADDLIVYFKNARV